MSPIYCPECGAELPIGTLGNRCPRCVLQLGLSVTADPNTPTQVAGLVIPAPPWPGRGRYFCDYQLLEEIARGGMGIVYKARQVSLNRLVAVKMILFGELAGPDMVERFRREAEAAAKLQHPNIVGVHEVGEHEGQHYFSMDYVAGPNLAALVGNTPLPTHRAARYVQQLAEAIAYAHGHGVLHRDLKPSNVLIDSLDQPRITDFGLAKSLNDSSPSSHQYELTVSGQILGTPNYLPPEQVSGQRRAIGPASDVYGLGAILYFLLTARPPFMGETLETTLDQVMHQEPVSPRLLNGSVPGDLETICLKCLEKESERRYATAQALADDLGRFLGGEPIEARPVSLAGRIWRWCQRKPAVASLSAGLLAAVVFGFAGVTWQWRRAELERQVHRLRAYASDMKAAHAALQQTNQGLARTLLMRHGPKTGEEDLRGIEWRYLWQECRSEEMASFSHSRDSAMDAALSSNGQFLVTTSLEKIRVWDTATGRILKEFPRGGTPTPKKSLGFSRDGKWLATRGLNGIEIRETAGWNLVKELRSVIDNSSLALSADGRIAVCGGTNVLKAWDWAATKSYVVITPNSGPVLYNLAISANGSRIAFSTAVPLFNRLDSITMWEVEQNRCYQLATNQDTTSLAISPDGNWLASGHYSGKICFYYLATQERFGPFPAHHGMVYGLAFSPNGSVLASGGSDQLVHIWSTGTTNRLRSLRGHESEIYAVSFSGDGQMLASGGKDGYVKLWNMQAHPTRTYTFEVASNSLPVGPLSDGSTLLTADLDGKATEFWRLPKGDRVTSLFWGDATHRGCQELCFFPKNQLTVGITTNGIAHLWDLTTGRHQQAISLGGSGFVPQHLSSDNRWLLGRVPHQEQLVLWDLQSSQRVTNFNFQWLICYAAAFSPDNRWLAFSSYDSAEKVRIWDLSRHRLERTLVTYDARNPFGVLAMAYSPDGKVLACGGYYGEIHLWSAPTGKALEPALKGHIVGVNRLIFSSDGKTLASSGGDSSLRLWSVAAKQELLLIPGAVIATGGNSMLAENHYPSQAGLVVGDQWILWKEKQCRIRVTPLPTLADIDAIEQHQYKKR